MKNIVIIGCCMIATLVMLQSCGENSVPVFDTLGDTSEPVDVAYAHYCDNGKPTADATKETDGQHVCGECDEDYRLDEGQCVAIVYAHLCDNGTPVAGATKETDGQHICGECVDDYRLDERRCVAIVYAHRCDNGIPVAGATKHTDGQHICGECADDYRLDDGRCVAITYAHYCNNGMPAVGATKETDGQHICGECADDYRLEAAQCVAVTYAHHCDNGIPTDGATKETDGQHICAECAEYYLLNGTLCVEMTYEHICINGTPADGATRATHGMHICEQCDTYYRPHGDQCIEITYEHICINGTPADGATRATHGMHICEQCDVYYRLDGGMCVPTKYTCVNGIAASVPQGGNPELRNADFEKCMDCDESYELQGNHCIEFIPEYVCKNGTAAEGATIKTHNSTKCLFCNDYYRLDGQMCVATKYTCANGIAAIVPTPRVGDDLREADVEKCMDCNDGYSIKDGKCVDDFDNDGVIDGEDIDKDNDGLIEIDSLAGLYNMRFNLAGTSYKTSATGSGNQNGTPNINTRKADDYACGDNSYGLCGYELTADISFDKDGDGNSWHGFGNSYFLDVGDDSTYFDVDNGGWNPIGDDSKPFSAHFNGNGHTINGLAIIKSNSRYLGLFGVVAADNTISNLILSNSLVVNNRSGDENHVGLLVGLLKKVSDNAPTVHNVHDIGPSRVVGSNDNDYIGGLIGYVQDGTIESTSSRATVSARSGKNYAGGLIGELYVGIVTASYATGDIFEAGDDWSYSGGLIGKFGYGGSNTELIASFATGDVHGSNSTNIIGGLVGRQHHGYIVASYATGDVFGRGDTNEKIGGLVGEHNNNSIIIASFANGKADAGSGREDKVGGLVGYQSYRSSIFASYATGEVVGSTGDEDRAGGLVGLQSESKGHTPKIKSSYATGNVSGPSTRDDDYAGALIGFTRETTNTDSYGFGITTAERVATNHSKVKDTVQYGSNKPSNASEITHKNFNSSDEWYKAWKFSSGKPPQLVYKDYDGTSGTVYSCLTAAELKPVSIYAIKPKCDDTLPYARPVGNVR